MPNRLAFESSPYLRQHGGNPVDWFPWGPEAFELARATDRPIFLSVGYSTCHWCHVMEHESFENPAVAAVLNDHFVSIKVDREERPDIDRVYMLFVQATTGAGGWPMSVWLTPDLQPFFGGTYFPPRSQWGRPAFVDVLREIARAWREERDRVTSSAATIVDRLRAVTAGEQRRAEDDGAAVPPVVFLQQGSAQYQRTFDRAHGGFGGAPKFPRPSELLFLLREHARTGETLLLDMTLATLAGMSFGGMRDHVGGGYHRYSVDAEWRVPHFEKMLYDQAQIVLTLVEASQASGDPLWAAIADDTLEYVDRDLAHPAGGYYSAEDADSLPPGEAGQRGARKTEGAFYLWTVEEIDALLGDDADVVKRRYGLRDGGNAPSDPQGEFGEGNIPYLAESIEALATSTGRGVNEVVAVLERARARLFEARQSRPRPDLDDKILTAWNGLMIAAAARASRVFAGEAYDPSGAARARSLAMARRAAGFARDHLWDPGTRTLLRRFRDGATGVSAYCEDYASLCWGLLELFQADGDPAWLEWAIELHDVQAERFWDPAAGGWFSTRGDDPSVLLRLKDDHDGAEPSASSVGALNSLVLAHLLDEARYADLARRTLARRDDGDLARSAPLLMCALAGWHAPGQQIVIVGQPDDPATRALHAVLARHYLPHAVVVPVAPGDAQARLAERLPFVGAMALHEGRPTAYVCRDFACRAPVTSAEELDVQLRNGRGDAWSPSRQP